MIHFPLHPTTPLSGKTLREMFGPEKDIEAMNSNMKRLMIQEGLPYEGRSMTYNSRLAQELGSWADTQEGGYGIHKKIYQAYFVKNKNIGNTDVLIDIVKQVGLNETEANKVMKERTFKKAVDQDWNKAQEIGVTGVPTYIVGGAGVVGAQPYETLAQLVEQSISNKRI